jgi:hypothetical protein
MPDDPTLRRSLPRRGLPEIDFSNANDSVARIPVSSVPMQTYGPPESAEHPQPDPRMNLNARAPGHVEDRDYDYAKIGAVGSPGSSTIAKNFGEPNDPRTVPRLGFSGRQEGPGSTGQLFQYAKMGQSSTIKGPPGGNTASGRGLTDQQQGNVTYDSRLQPIQPDRSSEPRRIDQVGVPMSFGDKPSTHTPQTAFVKKPRRY